MKTMASLTTVFVLGTAFLVVFLQTTFDSFRNLVGAQFDLLPSLMVYVSLTHRFSTVVLLSILGGLWVDSLSANTLGISILPLFVVGLVIQRYRILILREAIVAQVALGLGASALAPVLSLLLLLNVDRQPLLSWVSLWQWFIVSLVGAAVTPVWFGFFDRISQAIDYRVVGETSFRADREIKRGRS